MTILILTSKDHIYANYLLRNVLDMGLCRRHIVVVWEQDAIIPGKSKWQGLLRYLSVSGPRYVLLQMGKHWMFLWLRWLASVTWDTKSVYYPYWKSEHVKHIRRETVNRIKREAVYAAMKSLTPDVLLSLFSKEIIPERLLAIPAYTPVNLHPARLPEFRGVSPVFWAMATDHRAVGVTLHTLDRGIDTGSILSQSETKIKPGQTEHEVYLRLTRMGINLVTSYLSRVLSGKQPIVQKISRRLRASYFSLPTKGAMQALYAHGYRII